MNTATLDQARAAKARVPKVFGHKARIVGVGITEIDGGFGVKVNLREPPAPGQKIPSAIDGVPVHVEVVGPIRKL
jgi:hypothetical protein